MIQLAFQPAFDPYHGVFRMLRLRSIVADSRPLHRDHVRIIDFYLVFPFRIDGIRLIPQHRKYRKLSADYDMVKPYGHQPDDRIVFHRMEAAQNAALETLAARDLIAGARLDLDQVEFTSEPIPEGVAARVEIANQRDADLMAFLALLASEYGVMGVNGLKGRTNLLEYRYDAI